MDPDADADVDAERTRTSIRRERPADADAEQTGTPSRSGRADADKRPDADGPWTRTTADVFGQMQSLFGQTQMQSRHGTQTNRTRGEDVRELPLVNSCKLPTAVTTWYLTVNSRATQAKHYKVLNRFTQLLCQLLGRWLSDATN